MSSRNFKCCLTPFLNILELCLICYRHKDHLPPLPPNAMTSFMDDPKEA